MLYQAVHITTYRYEAAVSHCLSEAHLIPRSFPGQRVLDAKIEIDPAPTTLVNRTDYYGNDVSTFSIFKRHDRFVVKSTSFVEVEPRATGHLPQLTWEEARAHLTAHPGETRWPPLSSFSIRPLWPHRRNWRHTALPSFAPGVPLADAVTDLSRRIHAEFSYKPKSTSIDVPLQEVLQRRRGVCQDFAHVMIGVSAFLSSGRPLCQRIPA